MKWIMLCALMFPLIPVSLAQEEEEIFFVDSPEKTAAIPETYEQTEKPSGAASVTVTVDFSEINGPVSRYIFGNNANVYMTQMVDQPLLLDHIQTLSPNVVRYPGGNLSSLFFWNAEPGQPPADAPSKLLDANGVETDPGYWYGRNDQGWTLSVDNYYEMLEATQSTGIITVNYGYARYSTSHDPVASAAHLAAEWVRYDNGRTKFWEIGNESNGSWQAGYRIDITNNKDGQPQVVSGDLYGRHFRVFADSMRKAAAEKNHTIFLGAQLLAEAPASWWNDTDRHWNSGVFEEATNDPDFYIIHSYYTPYASNSGVDEILNSAKAVTGDMSVYLRSSITNAGLQMKPLALTEWNIFAEGSKQQVSYINGMHAAIVLGELIENEYGLACRWNLANGWSDGNDHGMFSQGDEPGVPKWHPRASWHYMYYFQKYVGDQIVGSVVTGSENVLAYASRFSSGETSLVVVNKGTQSETVGVDIQNFGYGERFYFHSLAGGTDNNPFSLKVFVNGKGPSLPSGGPMPGDVKARASSIGGGIKFESPGRSVQYIMAERGDNIVTHAQGDDGHSFTLCPNPVRDRIHITLPSRGKWKLQIIDMTGSKAFETTVGTSELAFEVQPGLRPGIYSVLLFDGSKLLRRRIFIY